jgi:hypothetical protein
MGATPGESSFRKMSKSLVRQGEAEKRNSTSSRKHMSGDDNVVGGEIETQVAFVIGGVSEENTYGGPRCQFVSIFGGDIGIAGTTKHTQVLIGGGDTLKGEVWRGCADQFCGLVVQ